MYFIWFIGSDKPSSSDEAKEKSEEKDETIDGKLENLTFMLEHLKDNFSTVKKNEELRKTLREVENLLQCFNSKLAEEANENETKRLEQPSQTSTEEEMHQHFIDEEFKVTGMLSLKPRASHVEITIK